MYTLIERYINILDKNTLNNFALKNNITLSEEELNFTYNFIKKNWEIIYNNKATFDITKYKSKYTEENFIKITNLIKEYKIKYSKYF